MQYFLLNLHLFLEMIENYCPIFIKNIPYLFQKDSKVPTGLQHLSNVIYYSECDYGTSPTGQGNESRIETSILFYKYISAIKILDNYINPNIPVGKLGFLKHRPWDFTYYDLANLSVGHYNIKWELSGFSKDSQAKTSYIPSLNNSLPPCQERYIRIKSDKQYLFL